MKGLIQTLVFFLLILFVFISGCTKKYSNKIGKEEVIILLENYQTALRSGVSQKIKNFWSKKSLDRPGFDVMHLRIGRTIHINEWKDFLDNTNFNYKVEKVVEKERYCIIDGNWIKKSNSGIDKSHPLPFYIVYEGNKWLLINPIDILPQNWDRYETENMIFYYSSEVDIRDHLFEIESLDKEYKSMCRIMKFSLDRKLEYYRTSSSKECGELLTQPPANGLAPTVYRDSIKWFQVAVSTTFYNPHEVMHVVSLSAGVPSNIPFFYEGFAVGYGGSTFQTEDYAHNYSKNLLDSSKYIPIKKLMTMNYKDFLHVNYISYQESGSFIRFLIDQFGIDKMKNYYSGFSITEDLDAQTMTVYNCSLDELEGKWKESLRNLEIQEIGFSIPDNAESVFEMTDLENDDKGDGDYQYPANDKYIKGCFDLTKFQVLKGVNSIYFKISMQKVIEPVSNRIGSTKFIPTVVIAINKGEEKKRQLYKYTNDIELEDGYDLKINVGFGVNVSNNFGKIVISTKDLYNKVSDSKTNTYTFSLPIELVGEPDDKWQYFVGTGLADQPSFNFSGLSPVLKNIPVLISGGNYDYSNPAFIDILLPEKVNQSKMISNYNSDFGKIAKIELVSKTTTDY